MIKQGNGQTPHHLGLALCVWLGSMAFLATGIWATILLVLTSRITAVLIITLIGVWVTLAGIFACFVTLWQLVRSPQAARHLVRRLQWLLGAITIIVAVISLSLSYAWAKSGDAPGIIFIGLFLAAMPFACWVLTSVWRLTLER
ncbi:hypothetical protein AUQ39_03035 [Lacticaseibacillus casei]|nr:hypothetical protein [Lacticaseibacillus zeae]OLS10739.1 hypothetical protein AUQ39_03035 [Lacticaseibacillus casei]QVI32592.1 hypothetical protein KG087_02900 [Lacticaseibacillus zeae]TLF40753.1 hypothetical protein FEI14_10510 [Lacticaseibacillus zeae]